ncbi:protein of unknown function DUF1177 [Sulfolobus islandicus Y.G.57.14]|jgi:hypothetical protein|uniref:DUF1177 domain-containing protein n=6 Tax=Saccharolobus islandicus TaxID=43080 RepID=C3MPK4_SACI2|nr:DUF1177 domain-containing protein [Sulfolobus islandicus]ACP35317.1 protein of unknown function DUF1177 [Sulfolobus islandicus L.S.2.15]ACP37974.1 protein of unknown function DUF1177 [Sulfolobus islandicus M.14.25]ACP45473.1 protein of unknown function DUF1177 [Sulfolobus islandicus Y.G.57.14]ACP48728.1 protein of unknown function DUF1177 [Sulfolobus islandicus Y.N.15.51]ACR41806.1 protein of unknown function DUF1177 [Sulfolobus islandicus M.16.4]
MMLKKLLEVIDILESEDPLQKIKEKLEGKVKYEEVKAGEVTFIKALYEGGGKDKVEILGRLGAIQMVGVNKGLVSDADGAIVSLTTLLELLNLREKGIELDLNVLFVTNLSVKAKLIPHKPFDFMVPLLGLDEALKVEVDPSASFVVSIDSTKGNRIAKFDDFAITHVVKDGYILKLHDNVIDIYNKVTGHEIYMVPLTTGDLTPLDYNVYHISTLISPWLYTDSPVIGIATVSKQVIPGYETGVLNIEMLEHASRFCIELLKYIENGGKMYEEKELEELENRLGKSNLLKAKRR